MKKQDDYPVDRELMKEAREPGKGVLNRDWNSPDGPSGLFYFYKGRRVEIPNKAVRIKWNRLSSKS